MYENFQLQDLMRSDQWELIKDDNMEGNVGHKGK
jgi:hypothetical protein